MDFQEEVGKTLRLTVTSWTRKGTPDNSVPAPVLGFGVKDEAIDQLLWRARTPEQKARDEKRMEAWMDLDYVPTYVPSRRREVDPDYSTLRMYHISGKPTDELVEGDLWEVEVVKCYLNPNEARTKDGRKKIHYSVRPIERVEEVTRVYDPVNRTLQLRYHCGSNLRTEEVSCDVRRARYRVEEVNSIVETEMIVPEKGKRFWGKTTLTPVAEIIAKKRQTIRGTLDTRPIYNDYYALPFAPKDLLEHMAPRR